VIIVRICGGLGNQMFRYAYAKSLKSRGYDVKLDIKYYNKRRIEHNVYHLDKFNINLDISSVTENQKIKNDTYVYRLLNKFGFKFSNIIKNDDFVFDRKYLNVDDNKYIDGYFQNENYFKDIRSDLISDFTNSVDLDIFSKNIEKKILKSERNCSLHVRRGDYTLDVNKKFQGLCNLDYYQKALDIMNNNVGDLNYYVFSDDMSWCKKNLQLKNVTYVDTNSIRLPHDDLYLMSLCQYNIIANSTFSWWAAWLNTYNQKIVIAPKIWFSGNKDKSRRYEIACDDWITI